MPIKVQQLMAYISVSATLPLDEEHQVVDTGSVHHRTRLHSLTFYASTSDKRTSVQTVQGHYTESNLQLHEFNMLPALTKAGGSCK